MACGEAACIGMYRGRAREGLCCPHLHVVPHGLLTQTVVVDALRGVDAAEEEVEEEEVAALLHSLRDGRLNRAEGTGREGAGADGEEEGMLGHASLWRADEGQGTCSHTHLHGAEPSDRLPVRERVDPHLR